MNIVILGGGAAGLYSALLIKKANPNHHITIIERNPADVTYGWGVVFSDRTLASFQRADYKTYEQITSQFVIWDSIDVLYRDARIRCGGHVIASISRKSLLNILQRRCHELGIILQFGQDIHQLDELPEHDLLIAADGLNSLVRKTYEAQFQPHLEMGKARYIWLGAQKALDSFTFIFRENEHGLFQVHAYPFSGTISTFIVECDEATWIKSGMETANEAESLAYCQRLLANDLDGAELLSNNSKWVSFPTLKTHTWHHGRTVLLGDAAHTAHFSIGSGTKLAMEDAIALSTALDQHDNLETALNTYEQERKPVVEIFQRAAQESQTYFETTKRYLALDPMPFTFQLLTRSGRITYDDLKLRDPHFGDSVDLWYSQNASNHPTVVAPPPMFTPLTMRSLTLSNRLVMLPITAESSAQDGLPDETFTSAITTTATSGAGLVMSGFVAISAEGRITPHTLSAYTTEQATAWACLVTSLHTHSPAKIALQLGHAGRRGATRSRRSGLDRPLHQNSWPLLSASSIPYTPHSQTPKEMQQADMDAVRDQFVRATQMAQQADFDMLYLHMAHGYLLASFLSPLTNKRGDAYGGNREQWMRYPLEVFDAVRTVWPSDKPIAVALSASDYAREGIEIEDAILFARLLKELGCDIIEVLAGQTTPDSEPAYGRGFLTSLSEKLRNEAGISTIVGGYLTTSNEVNTILAAGRADLCIFTS